MNKRDQSQAMLSRGLRKLGMDVRSGEGRLAVLFGTYYAVLFICFYTVKVVRQSTFVETLGAAKLPIAYLLVAICSYPALKVYDQLVRRLPLPKLIIASNTIQAGVALLFWVGFSYQVVWLPIFYYVWMTISFGIFISQFWTYTGSVFDPRQAKRLFTLIAAGGALGGILGGQTAYLASLVAGPFGALGAITLSLLAMAGLVMAIEQFSPKMQTAGMHHIAPEEKPHGGLGLLKRAPYIRYLALMTLASVVVVQIVDMQFNWAVERAVTDFQERTRLFGHFFSLISITAFLFLLVLTSQVHKRLGVASAMRLLPATVGLGTLGLLGAEVFFPAAVIWAACLLKIGEGGVRHSIEQVTRELLYLPVDSAWRAQAKATIDVFIQRFSKGAAALMLLTVSFGWLTIGQVGILSMILVVIWLMLTFPAHRFYIQHYRQGLQTGNLEDAQVNCEDVQTIELLVQSLGSNDPAKVCHAMELLRQHGRGKLVPPILLRHDDPDVRVKILSILIEEQRRDSEPLILACLGDEDQAVRAEAVRALAAIEQGDVCELMLPHLRGSDPKVRAAAIVCLSTRGTPLHVGEARKALFELCTDADPRVRIEAAKALGDLPEPTFQERLIQLLYDQNIDVVKYAIMAVRSRAKQTQANPIFIPTLISLMRKRRLKHACRETLVSMGTLTVPGLVHFMNDPEEQLWVRRALPKTLARIGGDAAVEALQDALADADYLLRRKVIESLVSLQARYPRLKIDKKRLRERLQMETRRYLQYLADLHSTGFYSAGALAGPLVVWNKPHTRPSFLQQVLAERMRFHVQNILDLVQLLRPSQDVLGAKRGLLSAKPSVRSHALEYLDHALKGDLHRLVFAVVGDDPVETKLSNAEKSLKLKRTDAIGTVRRILLKGFRDRDEPAMLICAALQSVRAQGLQELYALITQFDLKNMQPMVLETHAWVMQVIQPAAPNTEKVVHGVNDSN